MEGSGRMRARRAGWAALAGCALLLSCGRAPREGGGARPASGRPDVGADTAMAQRWSAARYAPTAPGAVPQAPVSPPQAAAGAGISVTPEPAAPEPGSPAASPAPPGFKPPVLKDRPPLAATRPGTVELELWVDPSGRVARAAWVGGSRDSALVRAAIDCALRSTFYPALRGGRPVPAASRQSFEFAGRPRWPRRQAAPAFNPR